MITGIVNARREATIRLLVRGANGTSEETEALVDTGFNGFLTLPASAIARLGLTRIGRGRALLADGSESVFDLYEAELM